MLLNGYLLYVTLYFNGKRKQVMKYTTIRTLQFYISICKLHKHIDCHNVNVMSISLEVGPVFAKGVDSFQDKMIPFFVFAVLITVIGFCQIFCIGLKIERVSRILIADNFLRFFKYC